jgi:hypothetical protein
LNKFLFFIFLSTLSNTIFSQAVRESSPICVSTEKVKVLYIGLENELLITRGNVDEENVQVSTNNGTIRKIGNSKYVTSPTSPGTANITVRAGDKIEVFNIKVRSVPDPLPMVGSSSGGKIPANVFKAQQGIRADLRHFVFEGVKYDVVSYTFYATGAGFNDSSTVNNVVKVSGNSFSTIQAYINKCRPGTTVVLDEIKAIGSDGQIRKLPTIFFNLY